MNRVCLMFITLFHSCNTMAMLTQFARHQASIQMLSTLSRMPQHNCSAYFSSSASISDARDRAAVAAFGGVVGLGIMGIGAAGNYALPIMADKLESTHELFKATVRFLECAGFCSTGIFTIGTLVTLASGCAFGLNSPFLILELLREQHSSCADKTHITQAPAILQKNNRIDMSDKKD